MGKAIIFDSGTLISLSMNGLFVEIRRLKEIFKGKFIITREVKEEIIDKPLKTKRFELEGLKLKQLLDEKVLELPLSLEISDKEIDKKTNEIINIANSTFIAKEKEIHIIDSAKVSTQCNQDIQIVLLFSRVNLFDGSNLYPARKDGIETRSNNCISYTCLYVSRYIEQFCLVRIFAVPIHRTKNVIRLDFGGYQ